MPSDDSSREMGIVHGLKHFPYARGTFSVGCADLADSKVFLRLFYPHQQHKSHKDKVEYLDNHSKRWAEWYPEDEYAAGYVSFKYSWPVDSWKSRWAGWAAHLVAGNPLAPIISNAKVCQSERKYPLVVFSHGNGGSRMTYSTLCSEVASRGFVVAAVEHADGSASSARRITSDGDLEWVPTRKVIGDDYNIRNEQVMVRAKECLEALNIMKKINKGDRDGVKHVFSEPDSDFKMDNLQDKVDFDKDSVLVGHSFGGSTIINALQVGQEDENKANFDSAFCLDAWMFPVRFESRTLFSSIASKTPIFFFNYEKFQWRRNLTTMRVFETRLPCQDDHDADKDKVNKEEASQERRDLASASSPMLNSETIQSNVATLKGAVHYVASDVPTLMAGTWLGHLASALDFKKLFKRSGDQNESESHHNPKTPEEGLVASQDLLLGFLKNRGFSPSDELKPDGSAKPVQDFETCMTNIKFDLIWGTRYLGTLPPEEEDK